MPCSVVRLRVSNARRLSYHTDFSANPADPQFRNPITNRGPIEGRPPGEVFAHQRWDEFFPKVGYVFSLSHESLQGKTSFPAMTLSSAMVVLRIWHQTPSGRMPEATRPSLHLQGPYRRPSSRVATANPSSPASITTCRPIGTRTAVSGATSTNCTSTTPHNGAESDGAANVHHFPGTFYDYRWSTTLARRDKINIDASDPNTGGPDNGTGIVKSPAISVSTREPCGPTTTGSSSRLRMSTKACSCMINYYSAKDRGNEVIGGRQPAPAQW